MNQFQQQTTSAQLAALHPGSFGEYFDYSPNNLSIGSGGECNDYRMRLFAETIEIGGKSSKQTFQLQNGGESTELTKWSACFRYFSFQGKDTGSRAKFSFSAYLRMDPKDVNEINAIPNRTFNKSFKIVIKKFNSGQCIKNPYHLDNVWGPIIDEDKIELIPIGDNTSSISIKPDGASYILDVNNFQINQETVTFVGPNAPDEKYVISTSDLDNRS